MVRHGSKITTDTNTDTNMSKASISVKVPAADGSSSFVIINATRDDSKTLYITCVFEHTPLPKKTRISDFLRAAKDGKKATYPHPHYYFGQILPPGSATQAIDMLIAEFFATYRLEQWKMMGRGNDGEVWDNTVLRQWYGWQYVSFPKYYWNDLQYGSVGPRIASKEFLDWRGKRIGTSEGLFVHIRVDYKHLTFSSRTRTSSS